MNVNASGSVSTNASAQLSHAVDATGEEAVPVFVKRQGHGSWVIVSLAPTKYVAQLKTEAVKQLPSLRTIDLDTLALHVSADAEGTVLGRKLDVTATMSEALGDIKGTIRLVITIAPVVANGAALHSDPVGATTAATAAASSFDPEAEAARVASIIFHDMEEIGSLPEQQARLGLGSLLKRPLPLSTLVVTNGSRPVLASDMLEYEGSFEDFSEALHSSVQGGGRQLHPVVAVTQASGSGKSKLAYAEGLAAEGNSLVVSIKVVNQDGHFAAPWKAFFDVARGLETALGAAPAAHSRIVAEAALAALRLLVVCYVEWVAMVLEAFRRDDTSKADLHQAALRCLRNYKGEAGVASLYQLRLAQLKRAAAPVGAASGSFVLSDAAVEAHADAVARRVVGLLGDDAAVVVWYDEAQTLLEGEGGGVSTPKIFMRAIDYSAGATFDVAEPRDCFYGLTMVMGSLLDSPLGWRQVLCGPWLELSERAALAEHSCVHSRILTLRHASAIGLEDMKRSLSRYFDVDLGALPAEVTAKLAYLQGRPKWFFDSFWQALWARISAGANWRAGVLVAPPLSSTAATLVGHISAAARAAVEAIKRTAKTMVRYAWDRTEERNDRPSSFSVCAELYAALKLNGGSLTITSEGAASQAIRKGLLALQPADSGVSTVELSNEPCIAEALEMRGDEASKTSPERDPVYQLLSSSASGGYVLGFKLTTSVKGPLLQLMLTWHVLRVRLRTTGRLPLHCVLSPFIGPGCLPDATCEALQSCTLSATRARALPQQTGIEPCAEFRELAAGAEDVVFYCIDKAAGTDIAFRAEDENTGTRRLVLVQAKAQQYASLADCLRCVTPAWQYTSKEQRAALLTPSSKGANPSSVVPSDLTPGLEAKPAAFERLAADHAPFFDQAIRVVFSVNGYPPATFRCCREVNRLERCGQSPVVLCHIVEAADKDVSTALAAALECFCRSYDGFSFAASYPSSAAEKAMWAPLAVAQVAAARHSAAAEGPRIVALADLAKQCLKGMAE